MKIIIFYEKYGAKFYTHYILKDISAVGTAVNKFIEKFPPKNEDYNDIIIRFV